MARKGPSTIPERLHRIEGQVRGVEKLIENGADTEKILIQVEAIISSLQSVKIELIKSDMRDSIIAQLDKTVSMLK